MSSLIKSLALLIAIGVGLAFASHASLVNGKSGEKIPSSLSELGDLDRAHWVKVLRSECTAQWAPDKAFEVLKKVDKIYGALDDDAKINRNEQKIVEQFEINQIDGDQFCTRENMELLAELSDCYRHNFRPEDDRTLTGHFTSIGKYFRRRADNFAFVCRSYVLKNLNKKVGDLNETDRNDMEQTLGDKLVFLKESNERLAPFMLEPKTLSDEYEYIRKMNSKWRDILLKFLKEKSGNNFDAKDYITTDYEGEKKFDKLFYRSVFNLCSRWINATEEARRFQYYDLQQKKDYTEKQASWMKYADVCQDIEIDQYYLAQSLYRKLKREWSMFPTLKLAMNKGLKKISHNSSAKSQ